MVLVVVVALAAGAAAGGVAAAAVAAAIPSSWDFKGERQLSNRKLIKLRLFPVLQLYSHR